MLKKVLRKKGNEKEREKKHKRRRDRITKKYRERKKAVKGGVNTDINEQKRLEKFDFTGHIVSSRNRPAYAINQSANHVAAALCSIRKKYLQSEQEFSGQHWTANPV